MRGKDQKEGMDYFMYGDYISKIWNRRQVRGKDPKERRKKGRRKERGKEGGWTMGADTPDQFDHFSPLVVLYILVFLFVFFIFFLLSNYSCPHFPPLVSPVLPTPTCWCFLSCIEMLWR